MKQNTMTALKKIIEEAVQKEVARQIKIVVQEIVNPSTPVNEVETRSVVEDKPKINVKDPVLNKILNETEGGIQGSQEAYPTMGGGAYTSDRVSELMGGNPMMANTAEGKEKRRQVGAIESMKARGVNSEQVGEDVVNALTRDYSGLMKAMNKKKNEHYRP